MTDSTREPRLFDESFHELTATRRFNTGLMSIFGVLAVAIGAVGIHGTMSFTVAQQKKSIGLRMALGATRSNVIRSVLYGALWRWSAPESLSGLSPRSRSRTCSCRSSLA